MSTVDVKNGFLIDELPMCARCSIF